MDVCITDLQQFLRYRYSLYCKAEKLIKIFLSWMQLRIVLAEQELVTIVIFITRYLKSNMLYSEIENEFLFCKKLTFTIIDIENSYEILLYI